MLRFFCSLCCLLSATLAVHADEFFVYTGEGKPSHDFLQLLPKLKEDPRFRGVEWKVLHEKGESPEEERMFSESAIRDGIRYLPTIVLRDERGSYAKVVGTVATQQGRSLEERLLTALAQKNKDRSHRLQKEKTNLHDARLYSLLCRISDVDITQKSALEAMLEETMAYISSEKVPTELKQYLLLYAAYPMQMHLYALAYNGGHTPESERLFLKAIAFLEEARDINPRSTLGRNAHKLREELRAARLQAAKLD